MLSRVITTTEEFYNIKQDWEILQNQDIDATYYNTFEFAKSWWDSYKNDKDKKLFIICIYEEENIVGIGPFIIQNERKKYFSWNVLRFLGYGDYLGVLVNRGNNQMTIIKNMFKCIEENKELWERIHLMLIKSNCLLASYLLKQNNYNNKLRYLNECPQLNFGKHENFEEYERKYATSSAKKYRNKLKREYNYSFIVIENNKETNVFDDISRLHKKSQKFLINELGRTERQSLYNDKKINGYLKDIYNNSKNIITFMLVDQSNNIIIYDTCYLYKRVLHSWNTAYDPEYFKYSVGKIINYEMMRYVFQMNLADVFDFGTGRYPWKFEWTDDFILVYQLDIWNEDTRKGRILKKLFEIRKKFLK